ncbi:MAG: STAS/SEC14 domain-containing protein [Bacteroidia bacterium]
MAQNRLLKIFERKEGKTRVYENGFVESTVYEGANIDVPYLLEGKKLLESTGLNAFYVLNNSTGTYSISPEARKLSASEDYSKHLRAVAVVVHNAAIAVVADLYLRIDKPATPTRIFSNREKAVEWLHEQMN